MVLCFRGKEVQVNTEVEYRGAVTFRLNNADLTEDEARELCETFQTDFGVPLNIRIDPQLLAMGEVEIFNYLLEADRKDQEVVHYQLPALRKLEELKILIVEPRTIRVCDSGICQLKDQPPAIPRREIRGRSCDAVPQFRREPRSPDTRKRVPPR
jgi:hypothetical protein